MPFRVLLDQVCVQISEIMKKFVFLLVVLGVIILCTPTSTKATNVRLWFKITVTNTCNPNWSGNYCVQLKLTYNTIPITTTSTNCTITKNGCFYFDFDLKEVATDPYYGVELIAASEDQGGCAQSFNTFINGGWYWDVMQSCSSNTPQISITL